MRSTSFGSICIFMFILLYLVSGADKEDNGEGRKLRSRDKTTTTNIDPQGSEDDGASDSSVRENKKNKKSGAGTGHFRTRTMEQ